MAKLAIAADDNPEGMRSESSPIQYSQSTASALILWFDPEWPG